MNVVSKDTLNNCSRNSLPVKVETTNHIVVAFDYFAATCDTDAYAAAVVVVDDVATDSPL